MIKLINLINEANTPEEGGFVLKKPGEEEFSAKGYRLGKSEVDPETGSVTTHVEYLPKFDVIRRDLLSKRKEFQPFKYSNNEDIAKVAKEIVFNMTKLNNLIFALDKMIELQKKSK